MTRQGNSILDEPGGGLHVAFGEGEQAVLGEPDDAGADVVAVAAQGVDEVPRQAAPDRDADETAEPSR